MKILNFFGKSILTLILLAFIFWGIVLATLQTQRGQKWALSRLVTYLEQTTQAQVQIGRVDFSYPFNLLLQDVSISQDNLPILTIQKFELCCAFSKLLQGRIVFSNLNASNIDIQQFMKYPQTEPSLTIDKENYRRWDAPFVPFYIKFENINLLHIRLSQNAVEMLALPKEVEQIVENSSFNLQGMLTNNPFRESITTHLLITTKIENSHLAPFSLGIDSQNHQLSFSFHYLQFPLQVIKADLPSSLRAHLAFYATASIDTWKDLIQNSWQTNDQIEGHFKLSVQETEQSSNLIPTLIAANTTLRGRYHLKSNDKIELIDLKIDHPNFSLEGDATLTSNREIRQGNFKGEIKNLEQFQSCLGKEMQGKIAFEGQVKGFLESPSFNLYLNSPVISVSKKTLQNIKSTLQGRLHDRAWNGFLTLSFDHQEIPLEISTSFDWEDQKILNLNRLQADVMHSHLEGKLSCRAPDYLWEGFIEAQADSLNHISHFLNFPLNGEGELKLLLAPVVDARNQKRQGVQAQLIGKNLEWMQWQAKQMILNLEVDPLQEKTKVFHILSSLEGHQMSGNHYTIEGCNAYATCEFDPILCDLQHLSTEWNAREIHWPTGQATRATGKAEFSQPLQSIAGRIQFAIQNILSSSFDLKELAGSSTLYPDQKQWPFQLDARGVWKENFHFNMEGNWHFQHDFFELQANRLSGHFGDDPLQIRQPFHFFYQPHGLQLSGVQLQLGEAEIEAEYTQDHQNLYSQIRTSPIPSKLFQIFIPDLPLTGHASFQGRLEGSVLEPKGQFQIELQRVQFIESIFAQKPFIAGKLHLNLDRNGIQLKSELNGIGHTPLMIAGNLPVKISLDPFNFQIDSHHPFELNLNAQGELDPYLQLFYNDTTNLSGDAKIAIRLTGQMHSPQVQGHIDLLNGVYESLSTGTIYRNIQAQLEGNGSKLVLSKFSAQDHKGGVISAEGMVTLDANKAFPFEFQIHPSRIFILDSDYAVISASGFLSLVGNSKQSKLQGELTVDEATVHLEEALPRQIKTVDVTYIHLPQGELPPNHSEKKEMSSPIQLDVKIHAPQDILIQGNHLKSEWKGDITVTGTPNHPQLHGDLRIAQGEYDFNGKKFNLNQGTIHFAGAPAKKTSVYIVASKDIDRIVAEIIVKGPTNKPVISFRSNPPLSQREVLSYILFNRGISDITSDQGGQLSQSFISLNSSEQSSGTDDFLSRLRNNIGIDRLDFAAKDQDNRNIGLQVGKNITENISVSVNQSMTSVAPIIAVEAKLRKNLKAQAEAGVMEDAPVRMSIKWKKDY